MNTPGDSLLKLPVHPWPTTVNAEPFRHISFSSEARRSAGDLVGTSVGYDAFVNRDWTPELFSQFVASREHLRVEYDGGWRPTLAAIASYLRLPFLVSAHSEDSWTLSFIDLWGEVVVADFDGGPDDFHELRALFFTRDLATALKHGKLRVRRTGPSESERFTNLMILRQVAVSEWKQLHARGRLVAPKGAELSADDLMLVPRDDIHVKRPVIAHARSSQHLYELIYPTDHKLRPLEVLCAVDGVLEIFRHAATGAEHGLGAHASEWAEWILNDSVAGTHSSEEQRGEGDSPEAQLYRLANNISEYEELEVDTSQFTTAQELGAWLDKALGNHNAPIVVRLLDDVTFMLRTRIPLRMQDHSYDREEGTAVEIRTRKKPFLLWDGVGNWLSPSHSGYVLNPVLNTVMDGDAVNAFLALNCLNFSALEGDTLPQDANVNRNSWFLVVLEGTEACMAFPAADTMLQVNLDQDGASAVITARERLSRTKELQQEYAFEQQWALWLDEDHQLSKEEIQAGLEKLGRIIEESTA
ncbi:hypothetical protein SRABI128_05680 [Microbacterium sp. Bi128]|nr:hypothetical protein SRABI128_05680 [Microbacterium sp. Bi128]